VGKTLPPRQFSSLAPVRLPLKQLQQQLEMTPSTRFRHLEPDRRFATDQDTKTT